MESHAAFDRGDKANERSDAHVLNTVILTSVPFFAGFASRIRAVKGQFVIENDSRSWCSSSGSTKSSRFRWLDADLRTSQPGASKRRHPGWTRLAPTWGMAVKGSACSGGRNRPICMTSSRRLRIATPCRTAPDSAPSGASPHQSVNLAWQEESRRSARETE